METNLWLKHVSRAQWQHQPTITRAGSPSPQGPNGRPPSEAPAGSREHRAQQASTRRPSPAKPQPGEAPRAPARPPPGPGAPAPAAPPSPARCCPPAALGGRGALTDASLARPGSAGGAPRRGTGPARTAALSPPTPPQSRLFRVPQHVNTGLAQGAAAAQTFPRLAVSLNTVFLVWKPPEMLPWWTPTRRGLTQHHPVLLSSQKARRNLKCWLRLRVFMD